jgi:hypothetical protein
MVTRESAHAKIKGFGAMWAPAFFAAAFLANFG